MRRPWTTLAVVLTLAACDLTCDGPEDPAIVFRMASSDDAHENRSLAAAHSNWWHVQMGVTVPLLLQLMERCRLDPTKHSQVHASPTTTTEEGEAPPSGDMFNLNSVVDCAELSRFSKEIFYKRCGRPGRAEPSPTASPTAISGSYGSWRK